MSDKEKGVGEFGEPWVYKPIKMENILMPKRIVNSHGNEVCSDIIPLCQEEMKRIVSCVNAMSGIADPQKFIDAVRGFVSEWDNPVPDLALRSYYRKIIVDMVLVRRGDSK